MKLSLNTECNVRIFYQEIKNGLLRWFGYVIYMSDGHDGPAQLYSDMHGNNKGLESFGSEKRFNI